MDPKRFYLIIPTYNRPQKLHLLLSDIWAEKGGHEVIVNVYDDHGDCRPAWETLEGVNYRRMGHNHGKREYWRLWNLAFGVARYYEFDYLVCLPDDSRLEEDFFTKAARAYETIPDDRKIALNLKAERRAGEMNWIAYKPRKEIYDGIPIWQTQWVDMLFIAEPRLLDILGKLDPVPSTRWQTDPSMSSGVGEKITRRLHRKDWHMYQIAETLVWHGAEKGKHSGITETQMNSGAWR